MPSVDHKAPAGRSEPAEKQKKTRGPRPGSAPPSRHRGRHNNREAGHSTTPRPTVVVLHDEFRRSRPSGLRVRLSLSPGAAAPFLEKPILLQQRQRRPGGRRIPVEPGARAAPPVWPTSSPSYESESGRSVRTRRRRRRPPASTSTARAPLNPAHAAPGVAGRAWAARERWTHKALRLTFDPASGTTHCFVEARAPQSIFP